VHFLDLDHKGGQRVRLPPAKIVVSRAFLRACTYLNSASAVACGMTSLKR